MSTTGHQSIADQISGHIIPEAAVAEVADNMAVLGAGDDVVRHQMEVGTDFAAVDTEGLQEEACKGDCCNSCLPCRSDGLLG
jgi:hypothetical protein